MEKRLAAGIDIGSTCAKTTVLDEKGKMIFRDLRPTGWSSVDTAESIRQQILKKHPETEHFPSLRQDTVGYRFPLRTSA